MSVANHTVGTLLVYDASGALGLIHCRPHELQADAAQLATLH